MKLEDDLLLQYVSLKRAYWTLALYAAHLGTGSTLMCKKVSSKTIAGYILDVAKFCGRFNERDPRKEEATQREMAEPLRAVLSELSRYDKQPNRREPYTMEMWRELHDFVSRMPLEQRRDSLEAACCDWFGSGLYGGYRRSEWAQEATTCSLSHSPQRDHFNHTKAFCLGDFEFFTANRIPVTREAAMGNRATAQRGAICYRTQKNGINGEIKTSTRQPGNKQYCNVEFLLNIVERFNRLVGWNHTVPLAVYKHESGEIRYITDIDITNVMRANAARTYKLNPKTQKAVLQKWSSHSLRVGACVILHSMGFTESQIQFLLRWRSLAFMCYLRNLAFLSDQQNEAISLIDSMPNFL